MKTNKAKKVNSTDNNSIKEDNIKDEISDENADNKNDSDETQEKNYCQRD